MREYGWSEGWHVHSMGITLTRFEIHNDNSIPRSQCYSHDESLFRSFAVLKYYEQNARAFSQKTASGGNTQVGSALFDSRKQNQGREQEDAMKDGFVVDLSMNNEYALWTPFG